MGISRPALTLKYLSVFAKSFNSAFEYVLDDFQIQQLVGLPGSPLPATRDPVGILLCLLRAIFVDSQCNIAFIKANFLKQIDYVIVNTARSWASQT